MTNTSKRNYILIFLDSILFVNAMTFLSINSVIPYFLNNLGASTFQISLASALTGIGTFISQPLFSKMLMKLPYKIKAFVKVLFIQRMFFLVFVLSIPFIASKSPAVMIIMFLLCWGIFNFFVGSYQPFFMSIMSKLIPSHQRGKLMGFAGALGNMIAIGSSILIGLLLSQVPYPYNYTIIFALGTLILLIDVLSFELLEKEPLDKLIHKEMGYLQYIKYIPKILRRNKKYSYIVSGYVFFVVTNVSLAYYSLHAIRDFKAGASQIAVFTGIAVVTNTIGSMIFGIIADKHGHKLVLQTAAICGLTGGILVLFSPGIISIYLAFSLNTLCASGYQLSSGMLIIQEVPKEELPIYLSINVMITLIIYSTFILLSGYIIDKVSFTPVFVVTTAASLGAFIIFKMLDSKKAF